MTYFFGEVEAKTHSIQTLMSLGMVWALFPKSLRGTYPSKGQSTYTSISTFIQVVRIHSLKLNFITKIGDYYS